MKTSRTEPPARSGYELMKRRNEKLRKEYDFVVAELEKARALGADMQKLVEDVVKAVGAAKVAEMIQAVDIGPMTANSPGADIAEAPAVASAIAKAMRRPVQGGTMILTEGDERLHVRPGLTDFTRAILAETETLKSPEVEKAKAEKREAMERAMENENDRITERIRKRAEGQRNV